MGVDECDRVWAGRTRCRLQARTGGTRHRLEAQTLGIGREYCVLTQMEDKSRAAIATGMHVRVRMGASLGANPEGVRIGEWAGARNCRKGVRGYGGGGYKLTFP